VEAEQRELGVHRGEIWPWENLEMRTESPWRRVTLTPARRKLPGVLGGP
jgi:hypothetical protein